MVFLNLKHNDSDSDGVDRRKCSKKMPKKSINFKIFIKKFAGVVVYKIRVPLMSKYANK